MSIRFEHLLIMLSLTIGLTMLAYAAAMSVTQVSQLGGSGLVDVVKTDIRVLSTQLQLDAGRTNINGVTISVSSSVSGKFQINVSVRVGTCSSSGSTAAQLGPTPISLTINVSPICGYTGQATVEVRVTQ